MPEQKGNRILGWFRDLFLENLFFKALGLVPVAGASMTSYFGIADGISWAYLIPAIAVSFGGLSVGLASVFALRSMVTVADRLAFSRIEVVPCAGIDGFSFRLVVANLAAFPLEFEVLDSQISLEGRTTVIPFEPLGQSTPISRQGEGFWNCGLIAGTSTEARSGKVMHGVIKVKILYGKPGKANQEFWIKKKALLQFDDNGGLLGSSFFELQGK